jgi:hypothetical protein
MSAVLKFSSGVCQLVAFYPPGGTPTALRQAGSLPPRKRGNSRPMPELFSAAGCKLQFDAATITPLIQLANTELKKL